MATAQKKKAAETPQSSEETPTAEPPVIHSVKPGEDQDNRAYVQIDADDYEEFLWWKASERVITVLSDRKEDEETVTWPVYWEKMPEAEKRFFAEIMSRFGEDILKLYLDKTGTDKAQFLRSYAGILLMDA